MTKDYEERRKHYIKRAREDLPWCFEKFYRIKDKAGNIVPFKLNTAQKHIHRLIEEQRKEKGYVKAVILKGRQQGCSTYVEARFYNKTSLYNGKRAFILTHEDKATTNLFTMTKRFHINDSPITKPKTKSSNAKELVFEDLDSDFQTATARTADVGRSGTTQYFHGSEVAFWLNAEGHMSSIGQTIGSGEAAQGTEEILESTANGIGNLFHNYWQMAEAGLNDFIPIFVPWHWQDEYVEKVPEGTTWDEKDTEYKERYELSDERMMFRRKKTMNDFSGDYARFDQEYPADAHLAFMLSGEDTFIDPKFVYKARKCEVVESHHSYRGARVILGVDPARFGDDRTTFVWRVHRKVTKIKEYEKKDLMEITGMIVHELEHGGISKVLVDATGLGAGIVDRLNELGYGEYTVEVIAAAKPNDSSYLNKRAEMWGEMRSWLMGDIDIDIPDSDALHSDLIAPHYSYDSNGRLKLESKKDIKARGLRSPDLGDALALTFAQPYTPFEDDIGLKQDMEWVV